MAFLTQRTPVSGIGADALFYVVKSPTTNAEDGPITAAQFIMDLGLVTGNALGALAYKNTVATTDLTDGAVTFAKIQSVSTGVLLGRSDAGAGSPQEITLGSNLSLSGGVLNATFSGVDLGSSPGADSVTITNTAGDNATIPTATPTQAGVMSAADKVRLNGIAPGAEVNRDGPATVDLLNTTLGGTTWQTGGGGGGSLDYASIAAKAMPVSTDEIVLFDSEDANNAKRSTVADVIAQNADDITQAALFEYATYNPTLRLLAIDVTQPNPSDRIGYTEVETIGVRPPSVVTTEQYTLTADDRTVSHNSASAKTVNIEAGGFPVGKEIRVWTTGGGAAQIRSAAGVTVNGLANVSADFIGQDALIELFHRGSDQWSMSGGFTNLVAGGGAVDPLVLWLRSGGTNGAQDILDSSSYAHSLTWGANVSVDTSATLYGSSAIRFPSNTTSAADYIRIPYDPAFDMGLKNFCFRMRFRADAGNNMPISNYLFGTNNAANDYRFYVREVGDELRGYANLGPPTNDDAEFRPGGVPAFANETVTEYVLERHEGIFYAYINGLIADTDAAFVGSPIVSNTAEWLLGRGLDGVIYEMQLFIEPPTRLYNGANYTPPTAEWTNPYA